MTKQQEIKKLHFEIRRLESRYANGIDDQLKSASQLADDKITANSLHARREELQREIDDARRQKRAKLLDYAVTLRNLSDDPRIQGYQRTALAVAVALFEGTKDAGIKRAISAAKKGK